MNSQKNGMFQQKKRIVKNNGKSYPKDNSFVKTEILWR